MDDLLKQKLNAVHWIALLRKNNLLDARFVFEGYLNDLTAFLNRTREQEKKKQIQKEIEDAWAMYTVALSALAQKYFEKQNFEDAAIYYVELLKYKNDDTKIFMNLCTCLDEMGLYVLENNLWEYIGITSDMNKYDLYYKLSENFSKNKQLTKSIEYRKKAMLVKENKTEQDYNNFGCLYNSYYSEHTEDTKAALKSLACFKKASNIAPEVSLYAKNATIMAGKTNRYKDGQFFWNRMLKINEMNNDDKFDYACFCMKTKQFDEWHKYYDARFSKENNKTQFPKLMKPYWHGVKDISKLTLLVHYEQGFGDSILFSGYLPRLQKFAKKLIFVVQDELVSLLQRSFPDIEIKPQSKTNLNTLNYNYHVPAMSIPKVLNLGVSDISVGFGYLLPDSEKCEYFKNKYFTNSKLKIGIALSGSNNGNKTRDIPIETFLMLEKLNNVELYSLTKGMSDSCCEQFKELKLHNLSRELHNFDDTAAAIMNCDLIITGDNVILNLAGALGKKTYALFNWSYEYRWFDLTGENVVFYSTVKPFVNTKMDDWSTSMSLAVQELKKEFYKKQ